MARKLQCVTVAAILALLAACGGDEPRETATLNRSLVGDVDSLDPHKASTTQAHRVLIDLFEGLLRHGPGGRIEGGLAEEWVVSDDGLTYTFLIRQGALWANGDPITASDFEYAFQRLVRPETGAFYAAFLSSIENAPAILRGEIDPSELGVSVIDERTIEVRLSQPTPYFPQLLTHPSTVPLHRISIEKYGDDWTRPELMVNNGAYILSERVLGSHIALSKNRNYHESNAVQISQVNYYIVVSDTAMYNRYRAGELHITETVPSSVLPHVRKHRSDDLHISPMLGVYYYGFNLTSDRFKDQAKLRAALSMVIDREAIVEKVTGRGEVPAYGWVPPGIEGYENAEFEWATWSMERRLERARSLYAEAGYSQHNPAIFELRYNSGDNEERIALAIQSMWRSTLGAEAVLHNEELKVFLANVRTMQVTEMFRLSWIADYFDPNTFLEIMSSDSPQNLSGYKNTRVDRLLQAAGLELDQRRRMDLFNQAEQIVLNDNPVIPLYFYVAKHLVKPEVQGWIPSSVDYYPSRLLRLSESD